tara:strand:- start:244 stop:786 length:543 start_codon:yes stop_codon:yes gene_type:complete
MRTVNIKSFFRVLLLFVLLDALYCEDNNQIGSKIPNLNIRLLSGGSVNLHDLAEDGPLLIDFWATWCVPCKKLMKFLNQYHLDYKDENFKVLMINTDTPRSISKARSYINAQDYKFYVGLDPNKVISKKLNGMVMPTLILVDKGGEVSWRHQGYITGEEVGINRRIQQILKDNQKTLSEG